MNYRVATILDRESHALNTTKVIDLNLADPVSQIVIIYEPVNPTPCAQLAHPAKCVTKIELVDGSDVLFSLSGVEAQAVDWYHRKQEPANILFYLPANNHEQVFNLNFGRHLWDPELAFNPAKFTNPQLKITLDIDAACTDSILGYLTVLAMIFDEKLISPSGLFMHKEIKDYALGAGTHEYTDLPVDFLYRKLFARIQKYGTGPEGCFSNIKLSEDNDRKIPINHSISQILKTLISQTRPYREWIIGHGIAVAEYFYCTPTYWPAFAAAGWRGSIGGGDRCFYEGDGGRFTEIQTNAGPNWSCLVQGWCPHGVIEIPFGLQDDPDDWYEVSRLGSLRLDLLSGSGMASTDSCQIFLQQLRRY